MIVGSVASSYYGDPRLTRDIDLVIELSPAHIKDFSAIFPESEFYVPPAEVLRDEALNRRSFNLIHRESGLKIDFIVRKKSPHAEAEFRRRKILEILPGLKAPIASPEDVILKKLQFHQQGQSSKHLEDCRAILSHIEIDENYMREWVANLNLQAEWELVRR